MTKREASRETLERLAERLNVYVRLLPVCTEEPEGGELMAALAAYRSEITPPLRTRAEVDAEIVRYIRDEWFNGGRPVGLADSTRANLRLLCAEPTVPERGLSTLICTVCGLTSDQEPTVSFRYSNNASGHRIGVVRCNDCHGHVGVCPR